MSDWIELDSLELNEPSETEIGGVRLTIRLSPHDVPVAVRGRVLTDCRPKKFLIEFRYLDEEQWRLEPQNDGVSVRVGKHSRRLYGVEMDASLVPDADRISVNIQVPELAERAIERAVVGPTTARESRVALNFRAAKAAIGSVSGRIFETTAH